MRFNVLYIFWIAALLGLFWIKNSFERQNVNAFFGAAETDERDLSFDHPVWVTNIYVEPGKQVQRGDTLMRLYRTDLDNEIAERLAAIRQIQLERAAQNNSLDNEIALLKAKQIAEASELRAEVVVEESEAQIQKQLRQIVAERQGIATAATPDNLQTAQRAAVEEVIRQSKEPLYREIRLLEVQKKDNLALEAARTQQLRSEIAALEDEKSRLVLVSPIDGFIDNLSALEGETVDAHTTLVSINPVKPTKVRGFIHETIDMTFHLGDSVTVASGARPGHSVRGVLVGNSPHLI
ncbi:MAG: efflux RND transporter periplasmic adaptor subunit, partial [Saprospiraceae bacterium]|nr:efflux RND transporter periplasmic adaptor subunit [Saprospiraceae bacterium]